MKLLNSAQPQAILVGPKVCGQQASPYNLSIPCQLTIAARSNYRIECVATQASTVDNHLLLYSANQSSKEMHSPKDTTRKETLKSKIKKEKLNYVGLKYVDIVGWELNVYRISGPLY